MKGVAFGAVGVSLLLTLTAMPLPAQAAVHGVDWSAAGVTLDGRAMDLRWDGCLGCAFGRYYVKIIDPEDPLNAHEANFFGSEFQTSATTGPGGNYQMLTMVGASQTPGIQLNFESRQFAGINNAPHWITGTVIGTYQGVNFVLAIPPTPWS